MLSKRTGFSRPWHYLQVASWALGLLQAGIAYGVIMQEIEDVGERIGFICLFSLAFGGTCGLALVVMLVDPTDPVVYQHQNAMAKGWAFDEGAYELICTSCQTNVSKASKHCAHCARCIAHFDHHCKWLNTCIGGRNYPFFAALLGLLETTELVLVAFGTMTITEGVNQPLEGLNLVKLVLLVSVTGLATVTGCVTLQLILFHIWLRSKGRTTYDYIKAKRQRVQPTRKRSPNRAPADVISTSRNVQRPAEPAVGEVSEEDGYSRSDGSPHMPALD